MAGDADAVVDSLCGVLTGRQNPCGRYWIYATLAAVGGEQARTTLKQNGLSEDHEFARTGAEKALKLLE